LHSSARNQPFLWDHHSHVCRTGRTHHHPHLHAYYQNSTGIYRIDQIDMIAGTLSRREQRLVEAWIVLHQNELLENWERLQSGELPFKIAPLK
jgi:hypothetical protein